MVAITAVIVLVSAVIVGDSVREETAQALDSQMKRHLKQASAEIAAATSKRFEIIQSSMLNPTAFALRDSIVADLPLQSGGTGYPGVDSPSDIRMQDMAGQSTSCTDKFKCNPVDSSRSTWYYSSASSYTAPLPTTADEAIVAKSKRLDPFLVALYPKHSSVKLVYAGLKLTQPTSHAVFRSYPASDDTTVSNLYSCFAPPAPAPPPTSVCPYQGATCPAPPPSQPPPPSSASCYNGLSVPDGAQCIACYNPAVRGWYRQAYCTHEVCTPQERAGLPTPVCGPTGKRYGGDFPVCNRDTHGMGDAVLTTPYQGAGTEGWNEGWMITMAKSVYASDSSTAAFLGVVGLDVVLGDIQKSIVSFDMLSGAGFAMLVTSIDGTIIGAPSKIYTTESGGVTRICSVIPSLCPSGGTWTLTTCAQISGQGVQQFTHGGKTYVWHGGCVFAARAGLLTHAVIVAVPTDEIRAPVANVMDKWDDTNAISLVLVIVLSAVTLAALSLCLFMVSEDIAAPIKLTAQAAKQITDAQYNNTDTAETGQDFAHVHQTLQKASKDRHSGKDEISDLVLEFTKMVKGLGDADKKGGGTETTADYPPNPVLQIPLPVNAPVGNSLASAPSTLEAVSYDSSRTTAHAARHSRVSATHEGTPVIQAVACPDPKYEP